MTNDLSYETLEGEEKWRLARPVKEREMSNARYVKGKGTNTLASRAADLSAPTVAVQASRNVERAMALVEPNM